MNHRQLLVSWFQQLVKTYLRKSVDRPDALFEHVEISAEQPQRANIVNMPICYFGSSEFRLANFQVSTNQIPYTATILMHIVFAASEPGETLMLVSARINDVIGEFIRARISKSNLVDEEALKVLIPADNYPAGDFRNIGLPVEFEGSVYVHKVRDLSAQSITGGVGATETMLLTIEIDFSIGDC